MTDYWSVLVQVEHKLLILVICIGPIAGTDVESEVMYFDFMGDLFHEFSLLTCDKIVMGTLMQVLMMGSLIM